MKVILSVLSDTAMVPVIVIASLTSFLLTIKLTMIKTQRARPLADGGDRTPESNS